MLALLALVAACADLLGFEPNERAARKDRASRESGAGRTSPAPGWPRVGEPCAMRDTFACPEPAAQWRLKCSAATLKWEFYDECQSNQRCNRERGVCETMTCNPVDDPSSLVLCAGASRARWCGPDYVTFEFEECDFRCVGGQGCVEPDGNDYVYVDRPRDGVVGGNPWPNPTIPVCLENLDAWSAEDIARVKDAFYRTWGRRTAVGLTGFGPCHSGSEGVSLMLAENCHVELASIPSTGFPGHGAHSWVTLCKTYLDAAGDSHLVGPVLFELAAVHIFGHVLGYEDRSTVFDQPPSGVMQQIVKLDSPPAAVLDTFLLSQTLGLYGATPQGSLRDSSARCVGFRSASNMPSLDACDGSADRSFRLADGRLRHLETGECLVPTGAEAVALGSCDSPDHWQVLRAEWRTSFGACVSAASSSPHLVNKACSPDATDDQLWSFEFPSPNRVRIRLASDGRCVRSPLSWTGPLFAELGACDGVNDLFDTSQGGLIAGGLCLLANFPQEMWSTEVRLDFNPCPDPSEQGFALSGPIESQRGALTATPLAASDDESVELLVTPVQGKPTSAQIFEFYF